MLAEAYGSDCGTDRPSCWHDLSNRRSLRGGEGLGEGDFRLAQRALDDFNHRLPATVDERSFQAHGFAVEASGHLRIQSELEGLHQIVAGKSGLAAARSGARHEQVRIGLALEDAGKAFNLAPLEHAHTNGALRQ